MNLNGQQTSVPVTDESREDQQGRYLMHRRKSLKMALFGAAGVVAAAVAASAAHAGYGACSISGCPCKGYMGNAQLCQNCGHQYGAHW
jgi:hypothetical protein